VKNIRILPTDKPSRLHFDGKLFLSPNYQDSKTINSIVEGRNIYITSDEEIKEGDWVLNIEENTIFKPSNDEIYDIKNSEAKYYEYCKKIILTTDQDLYYVQGIDDEFLEWFVKNPSCEEVKIEGHIYKGQDETEYKIIIPKEEIKQNQLERMYSEEDLKRAYLDGCEIKLTNTYHVNKWFEQFKNKQQ
jgi:hypothetical protein